MTAATSLCGICAGSGFLVDKIPLFPFLVGLVAGCTLVSSCPSVIETSTDVYLRLKTLVEQKLL